MLDCKKCGFGVSKEMGFAIRQNTCPGCGGTLMDNEYLSVVKRVKLALQSSRICSGKLSEYDLDVLSIFIKNKFIVAEEKEEIDTEAATEGDDSNKEVGSLKDIRAQVRSEVLASSELELLPDDIEPRQTLSLEDEVERKKSIARNSGMARKSGARVNRLSGV